MPEFETLNDAQTKAWERWQKLEKARSRSELAYAQASARARLASMLAEKIASDPRAGELRMVEQRAMLLRRQADALVAARRAAGARRWYQYRLVRLFKKWES
jgi:hypothetical protein